MIKCDAVEGPVDAISGDEMAQELNELKAGKATGPSDVSMELIAAVGVGIKVMAELCQSPR